MPESEFQPTAGMRRLLAAVLQDDGADSPEDLCRAARIHPDTRRRWLADHVGFGPWMNREVRGNVEARLWEVWLTHLRMALSGNLQAIKLLYDRFDPETLQSAAAATPADLAAFLKLSEAGSEFETEADTEARPSAEAGPQASAGSLSAPAGPRAPASGGSTGVVGDLTTTDVAG